MQPLEANNDILVNIKTKNDMFKAVEELDQLSQSLFTTEANNLENMIQKHVHYLPAVIFSSSDRSQIEKKILEIRDSLKNLPILTLIIAVKTSDKMISNISNWLYSSLGYKILLDIEVDRDILGGAKLVLNGNYRDYSLRKKIDDYFSEEKQAKRHFLNEEKKIFKEVNIDE